MDALTRTFIGLRPPQDIQEQIATAQMALRRRAGSEVARWTPPHELFLTICNLGELSHTSLLRIEPAIEPVLRYQTPFDLHLAGFGGAPNATQPRIAYITVGGETDLLGRFQAVLEQALAPLGLSREVTTLACYVPLGKLKYESESGRSDLGRAMRMTNAGDFTPWRVDHIDLLKSDVGPYGPTMVTLRSFPLG